MEKIENKKIKETAYIETFENGMKLIVVPKKETKKKYIIWATKFGSIDNHFIDPSNNKEVKVPDGVAHYLEHKMFEQKNGVDSLYTLMALGLDANAYTTNDHTAYLFGGVDNFYEGLDELMDYVQNPYFTDQNVEKERGIIGQEIGRYDDEPTWRLYINTMDCLYTNNPIKLDIAGTVESISHITKETLYACYNTFYHPSNMVMCIAGNFEPTQIIEEVKKRLLPRSPMGEIKRIYPEEPLGIHKKEKEEIKGINMPIFMVGYKDELKEDKVKEQMATEIIFGALLGKSSETYQKMYNEGLLMSELSFDFESSKEYSHVLISGESKDPRKVYEIIKDTIQNKNVTPEAFERMKKRIYGEYVTEYDDVESIGRIFIADEVRGINSFEYIDKFENIDLEYVNKIQNELFRNNESVISIVK